LSLVNGCESILLGKSFEYGELFQIVSLSCGIENFVFEPLILGEESSVRYVRQIKLNCSKVTLKRFSHQRIRWRRGPQLISENS